MNVSKLPVFSGPCPPCRKCGLPEGKSVGSRVQYRHEDDAEWVDRVCGHCGYTWAEQCADAAHEPCAVCGGFTGGQPCENCAERAWLNSL